MMINMEFLVEGLKFLGLKFLAIFYDKDSGDAESGYNFILEKIFNLSNSDGSKCTSFDPLGEMINGNKQEILCLQLSLEMVQ